MIPPKWPATPIFPYYRSSATVGDLAEPSWPSPPARRWCAPSPTASPNTLSTKTGTIFVKWRKKCQPSAPHTCRHTGTPRARFSSFPFGSTDAAGGTLTVSDDTVGDGPTGAPASPTTPLAGLPLGIRITNTLPLIKSGRCAGHKGRLEHFLFCNGINTQRSQFPRKSRCGGRGIGSDFSLFRIGVS